MKLTSLDDLFTLAEETPFFEKLQHDLTIKWGSNTAYEWAKQRSLGKLLQDTGVQIDREMSGGDPTVPLSAGPETARLNAEFRPVTPARVEDVMRNTYHALGISCIEEKEKQEMSAKLEGIMDKLQLQITPQQRQSIASHVPTRKPPKMGG